VDSWSLDARSLGAEDVGRWRTLVRATSTFFFPEKVCLVQIPVSSPMCSSKHPAFCSFIESVLATFSITATSLLLACASDPVFRRLLPCGRLFNIVMLLTVFMEKENRIANIMQKLNFTG
jgi:hypothetical protein